MFNVNGLRCPFLITLSVDGSCNRIQINSSIIEVGAYCLIDPKCEGFAIHQNTMYFIGEFCPLEDACKIPVPKCSDQGDTLVS